VDAASRGPLLAVVNDVRHRRQGPQRRIPRSRSSSRRLGSGSRDRDPTGLAGHPAEGGLYAAEALYASFRAKNDVMCADGRRQLFAHLDSAELPEHPRAALASFSPISRLAPSMTRHELRCSSVGGSPAWNGARSRARWPSKHSVVPVVVHAAGLTDRGHPLDTGPAPYEQILSDLS